MFRENIRFKCPFRIPTGNEQRCVVNYFHHKGTTHPEIVVVGLA
jgi:hypothetical protein